MDVKKEGMMDGMMPGMMDDMMCPHDPRELLNMVMQHEQMEIPLYNELAQSAPSMCLRQKIMHMAKMDAHHAEMYARVAAAYGFMPVQPPGMHMDPPGMPPNFYAAGEQKDKK